MTLLTLLRHARRNVTPPDPGEPLPDDAFGRLSMLNASSPFTLVLPPPDGAIETRDRMMLVHQYVRPA